MIREKFHDLVETRELCSHLSDFDLTNYIITDVKNVFFSILPDCKIVYFQPEQHMRAGYIHDQSAIDQINLKSQMNYI